MKKIELTVKVANETRIAKASHESITKGGAIYYADSEQDALLICYHYRLCSSVEISRSVNGDWFVIVVR